MPQKAPADSASKTSYHHGDLRNALLDAADRVLESQGLQGFTLRACAREAAVSHAAPAHHFGDRQGLLQAVAERGYRRLISALQQSLGAAGGNLEAEMQAITAAYVGFAEANAEHFRIMFRKDLLNFGTDLPDALTETFTELTNVILRQRGEPEITPQRMYEPHAPNLINDILLGWCYVHGYAHLKLEGQLGLVPDDAHAAQMALAAARLSALIRGISPPG